MENYKAILHKYWGYDSFRGIQEDIINSIGEGNDTLGLMPTGGGKSITFQVPALAQEGLCLVITPLIALMKDQVSHLRSRGIKAAAIYSGMNREDIITALENCIFGDYKFLYISPERLSTEIFQAKLKKMKISFITVDESHCISQWGYDFRPAYLQINQIRTILPQTPILALTATATPEVVKDIQCQLHFKKENVFRMSFNRDNLAYVVRKTEDKYKQILHILNQVKGSAIIYARNRLKTKETAIWLQQNNISAEFYHAGLSNDEKDLRQKKWQCGESRVMVATNAFGMGIDKPDVRLVIHLDTPDSPEAYFQEAGRAGRDGEKAYAILLFSSHDQTMLKKRITDTFPEKDFIRNVYEHLCYYYQMAIGDGFECCYEFNLNDFCHRFKHFPIQAHSALKILSRCGYIDYTDEQETGSRLIFTLQRDELYKIREQEQGLEELIYAILRNYTGLFSDYVYIDEKQIGKQLNISRQQVYEQLIKLNQRRIIHYIPGKTTPYVTFTQRRVDINKLIIPKEVYEERKKCFENRICSMIEYATSETRCRNRMLLNYFGEKSYKNCQHCDICLHKQNSEVKNNDFENIQSAIFNLLKDGEPHSTSILSDLTFPPEKLKEVMTFLIAEEEIQLKNGMIRLCNKKLHFQE